MPDVKLPNSISAIIHLPADPPYPLTKFYQIVGSFFNQFEQKVELIILDEKNDPAVESEISCMNTEANKVLFIKGKFNTLGGWLNEASKKSAGGYLLYIDNTTAEVYLNQSALVAMLLVFERNPNCGMVYSDYDIQSGNTTKEMRLLKHHSGRVRDNQDYGRVFMFSKQILSVCKGFDNSLKYNTLYDIRLKIAEHAELRHISNRYAGSLYRVHAEGKGHNVFDYLMASKDSQLEAEKVLTAHLKRINAYLKPGMFYEERPLPKKTPPLKASVIIPVNNRARFIGTAIESVLNQSIHDIECIVVVNGGSNDPTIAAVQEYMLGGTKYDPQKPEVRLLVVDINNIGLCLNLGTKAAQGEFYVQLDSDDRLKPDAVKKILEVFRSDPKIGIVIGSYEVWQLDDTTGRIDRVDSVPVVTHDEWTEENGRNNLLRINGAGAPRSIPFQVIKNIGYFGINDEPFARNYGEDYEMVLKISERHRVGRIWEPVYDVVRHSGGTDHSIDQATIDRNDEAKDFMRMEAITRRQILNKKP